MAVLSLPMLYRRKPCSTNELERLNLEIRRRQRVVGIFPNCESAVRLLGAVLMEQDEAWSMGRKYFDMATYWEWKAGQQRATARKAASEVPGVA